MNSPLQQQIDAWCRQLQAQPGVSSDYVEEIKDHLYSHVLQQVESGVTPADALAIATHQLGDPQSIGQEFFKNRSLLYRVFSKQIHSAQGVCMKTQGKDKFTMIAHALLFAAAILVSSFILKDTDHGQTILWVMLSLWFSTSLLFESVREQLRCEWRFIKRVFGQA